MRRTKSLLSLPAALILLSVFAATTHALIIEHFNGDAAAQTQNTSAAATQTKSGADKKPVLSPPATTETVIGGKRITINYNTPLMRGRKIMGGLVPYGKVWRTGANAATTLITEADLNIGGLLVPKGTYTIYTLPNETDWKLIINKQTKQWGTVYNEDQDLGRVPMQLKQTSAPVEKFAIAIDKNGGTGGVLILTWENTQASVRFTVAR